MHQKKYLYHLSRMAAHAPCDNLHQVEEIEQSHGNLYLRSACILLLQVGKLLEILSSAFIAGVLKHTKGFALDGGYEKIV